MHLPRQGVPHTPAWPWSMWQRVCGGSVRVLEAGEEGAAAGCVEPLCCVLLWALSALLLDM